MKQLSIIGMLLLLAIGCNDSPNNKKTTMKETNVADNPLLKESGLPYGAPDFSKITEAHFRPAFAEAMHLQSERIKAIAESAETPTFENTIIALEKSGTEFQRVENVFNALTEAHTNDSLQAIQRELSPRFAAHRDSIYLNDKLFTRIKILYNERGKLTLDKESEKLLTNYYEKFTIAGANLPEKDKETLKQYNEQLASLETQFNQLLLEGNLAAAQQFTDRKALEGLSEEQLESIKEGNGWKVPLQNTTQQPLLSDLKDRTTRQRLFDASWKRTDGGAHSTNEVIVKIATLRAKKAQLLGFKNYAEWSLQQTMAKTPEAIEAFFAQLVPASVAKAKAEGAEIQAQIKKTGGNFALAPYDWNYYAEQVRKAKYDLDENAIKPYFELKSVVEKGVFYAATQLYGITFKERKDIPVYHPDVWVYELFDANGEALGLFYADYYARPSKRGGAWMSNFVDQSTLLSTKPVIYNVCNYTKGANGAPTLLTYDEVSTLFHEFGHALHGFFASQKYASLSGTAVARDFVEFPSQFNEHWALYPAILTHYAHHYKTGKVIPQSLIDKIKKAATFNQGYAFTEVLAASALDLQWHSITANQAITNATAFEQEALKKTGLALPTVPPRYRSSYFAHIFGGGYGAGYYSYQWTEMLAHDAYDWFEEHDGLTRENGDRFRKLILSRGNTEDYKTMYEAFRGKAATIAPLLKFRGLK